MGDDKVLAKLKLKLKQFCADASLSAPDFDDILNSVLTREEIWATNIILARELKGWIDDYNSFEEINQHVKQSLGTVKSGKVLTGVAALESDDVNEIAKLIRDVQNQDKDLVVQYLIRDTEVFGYIVSYYKKVRKHDLIGKLPYTTPRGFLERRSHSPASIFQHMVHEGIHTILIHNDIYFKCNALEEGLCVYFHKAFFGLGAKLFYAFARLAKDDRTIQCKKWAKYLKKYFKSLRVKPKDAALYLKNQIKHYGINEYRNLLIKAMREGMGKHFESNLKYQDYSATPA